MVVGQPQDEYLYTIYLIGACIVDGLSARDSDTIASNLQMKINQLSAKPPVRVRALGGGSGISKLKYVFGIG